MHGTGDGDAQRGMVLVARLPDIMPGVAGRGAECGAPSY
jgi:hypothetical protein